MNQLDVKQISEKEKVLMFFNTFIVTWFSTRLSTTILLVNFKPNYIIYLK